MSIQDPSPASEDLIRFPLSAPDPLWHRGALPLIIAVLLALATVTTVINNLRDGNLLVAVALGMFFGPLVCVALGATGRARPGAGSMRLVNTEQGWRHVASVRPQSLVTVVGVSWLALGLVGAAVVGVGRLAGLVELPANAETSTGGVVIAIMVALALAGALALLAASMLKVRRSARGDGPSALGVGLSPQGVHLDLPGNQTAVRWQEITDLAPELISIGRSPVRTPVFNRRETVPMVRLHTDGPTEDRMVIPLSQLNVSPDLLWTALTWYLHHGDARWELERAEGTTRLAFWQQAALVASANP